MAEQVFDSISKIILFWVVCGHVSFSRFWVQFCNKQTNSVLDGLSSCIILVAIL